jgi:hypothetical protein
MNIMEHVKYRHLKSNFLNSKSKKIRKTIIIISLMTKVFSLKELYVCINVLNILDNFYLDLKLVLTPTYRKPRLSISKEEI